MFVGQIYQESCWWVNVKSLVGVEGLVQFMLLIVGWISGVYFGLCDNDLYNLIWVMCVLVMYDKYLYDCVKVVNLCECMVFVLSGYNGGLGWVYKCQKLFMLLQYCLGKMCDINLGIVFGNQCENVDYLCCILK